ncbi:MAG TPA: hypothetical protein PLO52_13645, partial [Flavobacterium alvei]|nr:hypothetical protein [Flavobacterium alvei]
VPRETKCQHQFIVSKWDFTTKDQTARGMVCQKCLKHIYTNRTNEFEPLDGTEDIKTDLV